MSPREKVIPEALSLQRAARLLDVHEDTIRNWWKAGRIEVVRCGPKLLRVPRSEIARIRAGIEISSEGLRRAPKNAAT